MSDSLHIQPCFPPRSLSPIIIDIPDSPLQSPALPPPIIIDIPESPLPTPQLPLPDLLTSNDDLFSLLQTLSPSPTPFQQISDDYFDIPFIPDSPPRSPLLRLEPPCYISDSTPSSPMHLDPIPDSPPRSDAVLPNVIPTTLSPSRTVDAYKLLPFLPIITSPAARLRGILGERQSERAMVFTRLDKVRTQIAELDRQIQALEGVAAMSRFAEQKTK
jgi:hypothetical protein